MLEGLLWIAISLRKASLSSLSTVEGIEGFIASFSSIILLLPMSNSFHLLIQCYIASHLLVAYSLLFWFSDLIHLNRSEPLLLPLSLL